MTDCKKSMSGSSFTRVTGEERGPKGLTDGTSIRPKNRQHPVSLPFYFFHPLLRQLPSRFPVTQSLQTIHHHQIIPRGSSSLLANTACDELRDVIRVHDRIRPPEDQHRDIIGRGEDRRGRPTGLSPGKGCFISPNFLRCGRKTLGQPNVERQPDPRECQNHLELQYPRRKINLSRTHILRGMGDRDRKFFLARTASVVRLFQSTLCKNSESQWDG